MEPYNLILILLLAITLVIICPAISLILFITHHTASPLLYTFLPLFGASVLGAFIIALTFLKHAPRYFIEPRVAPFMAISFTIVSFLSSLHFLNIFWAFNETASWIGKVPFLYLHFCVLVQYAALSSCKLRSKTFLYLISYPCSIFFSAMLFSLPLLPFIPILPAPGPQILFGVPLLLACFGLSQTIATQSPQNHEHVHITVPHPDSHTANFSGRTSVVRLNQFNPNDDSRGRIPTPDRPIRPLKIIQITGTCCCCIGCCCWGN